MQSIWLIMRKSFVAHHFVVPNLILLYLLYDQIFWVLLLYIQVKYMIYKASLPSVVLLYCSFPSEAKPSVTTQGIQELSPSQSGIENNFDF